MEHIDKFEFHLRKLGLSKNTIHSYLYAVNYFDANYDLSLETLLEYKGYLIEKFKPKTVNLRIQALNCYLKFIGESEYYKRDCLLYQNLARNL